MTTLDTNVGDDFIREGIVSVLEEVIGGFCVAYISKHDPESIRKPCADELCRYEDKFWDAEIVVECGAPVFWHLGNTSTPLTSEWYEWLWRDRIFARQRQGPGRTPRFFNLGAGSCSYWGQGAEAFLSDPACADYARKAVERSALTVVRDSVASNILQQLNLPHEALPCPAFLAALRHPRRVSDAPDAPLIVVNLMELGGHFTADAGFDVSRWRAFCLRLIEQLQALGNVVMIAHDKAEQQFLSGLAPGLPILLPASYHAYHDVFRQLSVWIGNRVHGAVCAAGYGVPALILGNDTRARIGDYVGLKVERSADCNLDGLLEWAEGFRLRAQRAFEMERLLDLQAHTRRRYVALLHDALA